MSLFSARTVNERRHEIAVASIARLLDTNPNFGEQYCPNGIEQCVEETATHILYLSQAMVADTPEVFEDYVAWAHSVEVAHDLPESVLPTCLRTVASILADFIPAAHAVEGSTYIHRALNNYRQLPGPGPSYIDESRPHGLLAARFLHALLSLQRDEACALIHQAAKAGAPVTDMYLDVLQPALYEIGRLWQTNKISVATEHYCAAVSALLMDQLQAQMPRAEPNGGRIVLACVAGEQHEIGCRMLSHVLQMAGWDAVLLGANVPSRGIADSIEYAQPHVLCLSLSSALQVSEAAEAMSAARRVSGKRPLKVLIGGPLTNRIPALWQRLGADHHAPDARTAVDVCARYAG